MDSMDSWDCEKVLSLVLSLDTTVMLFGLIAIATLLYASLRWHIQNRKLEKTAPPSDSKFAKIEPVRGFQWTNQDPEQIRVFKPKYHLTMGKSSFNSVAVES